MIRHLVFIRFAATTTEDEKAAIFADLSALKRFVPGLRAFAGGPNVSTEGLARGFTHGFSVDFDDVAARDAYLIHPAHQAAGARLVKAAEGGVDGLAVLDFAA
jgi:hypothetical protein